MPDEMQNLDSPIEDSEGEEIAEHQTDIDIDTGFDNFFKDRSGEKDDKKEEKPEKKEPKNKDVKKDDHEPDEDLDAKLDETEKRLKALDEEGEKAKKEDEDKPEKEEAKAEKEPEEKKPDPPKTIKRNKLTKETISTYLNYIPDDMLPDKEVIIGDLSINLRELQKDDPEQFAAMKLMSIYSAHELVMDLIESGELKKAAGAVPESMIKKIDMLTNQVIFQNFLIDIAAVHPDVFQIRKSKEWSAFLNENKKAQKLLSTSLPDDAIKAISLYKETLDKDHAEKEDKSKNSKKKAEVDELLGNNSMKTKIPKQDSKSTSPKDVKTDVDEGFSLFLQDKKAGKVF